MARDRRPITMKNALRDTTTNMLCGECPHWDKLCRITATQRAANATACRYGVTSIKMAQASGVERVLRDMETTVRDWEASAKGGMTWEVCSAVKGWVGRIRKAIDRTRFGAKHGIGHGTITRKDGCSVRLVKTEAANGEE